MEEKKQTEIQRFVFPITQQTVRVLQINGKPWWVARDVCQVLEHTNPRIAVSRLDDDEKGVTTVYTLGGNQEINIINESGLYFLILSSRKPEAKPFKKRVTSEVLPAIRETGSYGNSVPFDPMDPQQLLTLLQSYATKQIELSKKIEQDPSRLLPLNGSSRRTARCVQRMPPKS